MIKLTNADGTLSPTVRNILSLVFLTVGFAAGWFSHANWYGRGEVKQVKEDNLFAIQEMAKVEAEKALLTKRIVEKKIEKVPECLRVPYPTGWFNQLRSKE